MHRKDLKLLYALILAVCLALLPVFAGAEESLAAPEEQDDAVTEPETDAPEEYTAEPEEPADTENESEEPIGPGPETEPEDPETPEEEEQITGSVGEEQEPSGDPEIEEGPAACGEQLFWQVSDDGTELVFTGRGAMTAFADPAEVPWVAYKNTVSKIVFPEELTGIGAYAFNGFSELVSVELPASLQSIGTCAFADCAGLRSVIFYGEVPVFANAVFSGDTLTVYYQTDCLSWTRISASQLGENVILLLMEEESEPLEESEEQEGPEAPPEQEEPEEPTAPDEPADDTFIPEIVLNKDYIRLDKGETYQLLVGPNFVPDGDITWSVSGDAVSVVGGLVTAEAYGIAYITVSAEYMGETVNAVCCVEVVQTTPVQSGITEIRLVTAATTVEVYKTEYAHIRISPILGVSLSPRSDTDTIDNSSAAVDTAAWTNPALSEFFTLHVLDNETLEIIPTGAAVDAAQKHSRDLKGSYVTGITLTAGGKEFTPYETVKITVKRSRPFIQAEPIVFNSYTAELGKKTPFTFTGGKVTACELINNAPSWLEFDPYNMEAGLSPTYVPDRYNKGKLVLSCEVEGWMIPARVTVQYSGKNYVPKLTFSEKNITLFAGTNDTAKVTVKLSPSVYADTDAYPIVLTGIEQKTEKGYIPVANGALLSASYNSGVLTLSAPEPAKDGEEHIYRVNLSAVDKEFTCTVRVPAPGTTPKPSLRSSGNIDPEVPGSAFTITVSRKNYHSRSKEEYTLTSIAQYKGKTPVNNDVRDLFTVTQEGNSFILREKQPGTVPAGYTYRAEITLQTAAGEASSAVTVKISTAPKNAALKVSLQTEGTILLSEPDSFITLTPSVRPRKKEEEFALIFFKKKDGKTVKISAEDCPFTIRENDDGTYTLMTNELTETDTLYYVQLLVTYNGKSYASKTMKLSVKR